MHEEKKRGERKKGGRRKREEKKGGEKKMLHRESNQGNQIQDLSCPAARLLCCECQRNIIILSTIFFLRIVAQRLCSL